MIICKLYKDSYTRLIKSSIPNNEIWLLSNSWDDHGYHVTYDAFIDEKGSTIKIGYVKFTIRPKDVAQQKACHVTISDDELMNGLDNGKFSLGGTEYYRTIRQHFSRVEQDDYYKRMGDIAFNQNLFDQVENFSITRIALLRDTSPLEIREKFHLIASGKPFNLQYEIKIGLIANPSDKKAFFVFNSSDSSYIPQNLYVLIGPNGCGKSFLLRRLYKLFKGKKPVDSSFLEDETVHIRFGNGCDIKEVLFVSYSAIDEEIEDEHKTYEENHPQCICIEKSNAESFYSQLIILRDNMERWEYFIKILADLHQEVTERLHEFLKIGTLQPSDITIEREIKKIFSETSSGNKVMLYSLVVLIGMVKDGTILLLDEPENHMHPALLSTMIQVYQRILSSMNAVGIIATHSPLVLQEVPSDNVTIMNRFAGVAEWRNPEIQTYGSPIHALYRDVFNTGIREAGYVKLFEDFIEKNPHMTSTEIRNIFTDELGDLAAYCLVSILYERDIK